MAGNLGFIVLVFIGLSAGLELRNQAYEGFVIKVAEDVPAENCQAILENVEATLTSASQYLFSALNSRAYLRSATVLLPPTWPDSCVKATASISAGAGETSDVTISARDTGRGKIFTQQSLGCGQPGDQIFMHYEGLIKHEHTLGRLLVKNFAMYRYGVFEEQGYFNDPIYPMCFVDDKGGEAKVTGCSDLEIHDNGICTSVSDTVYNTTKMVDEHARISIMFAAEAPNISMFCDEGNHDSTAPTKHNSLCQRQSVLQVIMAHKDFATTNNNNDLNPSTTSTLITNTTPRISYVRQKLTRYVFVIENTKDMLQRESWNHLRRIIRHWALNILPENTEVGMVVVDEQAKIVMKLGATNNGRHNFYSAVPYTPEDTIQPGCIHCGLKSAADMLVNRSKSHGSAENVIVVIAPGMNPSDQLDKILSEIKKNQIKIATITYPTLLRSQLLNKLADETSGVAYTVFEKKLNIDTTLFTTYYELINVFLDLTHKFYSGSVSDLPIEIHRRKFVDDGRSPITGSFVLDHSLGQPSQFSFFTHNSETPLISNLKLISPSHQEFTTRSDRYIDFKTISLEANISEPGTWTYTVDLFKGNPHPQFLQVTATPLKNASVVRANFKMHRNTKNSPLILICEVKRGDFPVLGAKVEAVISKLELNGTTQEYSRLELLDSGSGDPDITKGDGIYTRYVSFKHIGVQPGLYTFDVKVTDNGNAYASNDVTQQPCCGSQIPPSAVTTLEPFQRILPTKTVMLTFDDIDQETNAETGRVGDLRAEVLAGELKARLTWTAPDMGGKPVSHYEIKYGPSIESVSKSFETGGAILWENGEPLPLSIGAETTFNLNFGVNRELLDKAWFFAIKAYSKGGREVSGPVSNWVRILVPSPPVVTTASSTNIVRDRGFWPQSSNVESISPSIAKSMYGLELILPIVIGIILLVILLVLYCYFCVIKRRDNRNNHKKSTDSINKNDKLSSTITIVPSSPQNFAQTNYGSDLPDPHQVGVPIQYDYEEEKKRYSLVNQQEQQLIEELKQQQQMALGAQNQGYVSVISGRNGGHTLSPYNSWSASQLLHEHERRHSPMENVDEMNAQELLISPHPDHMVEQLVDHYGGHHIPPPVPPLPAFNGYPVNYQIYGGQQQPVGNNAIYQSMQRQQAPPQQQDFNASLQGSLSSVNSGDKKRRNVTMV